MTSTQAHAIKGINGYKEPSRRICRFCQHATWWHDDIAGIRVECGVDTRGRFPVEALATCDKFKEAK